MDKRSLPFFETFSILINGNIGLTSIYIIMIGIFISENLIKDIDFVWAYKLSGETEAKSGVIIDVFETKYSINEESIYGYEYQFDSHIGEFNGVSYSPGLIYNKH